jgi:hypothetical protein
MTPAHVASLEAVRRRSFGMACRTLESTADGDPHARYFGTELHGDELTPGDGARIGAIDFETSFATHPQGARR